MEMSDRLNKNWGWLVGLGVVLLALGILAIGAAVLTTLFSVVFLGSLLIVGGVLMLINAFKSWHGSTGNLAVWFILGLLYTAAGILLVTHPTFVAISFTLLLAIFYLAVGVMRLLSALFSHLPRKGWNVFTGLVAIALGVLILMHWPASGLFIIGLFVGIDLVLNGWSFVMLGLASRQ